MKRIARTVLLLISILTFAACEGDNPYSSYHANVIFDGTIYPYNQARSFGQFICIRQGANIGDAVLAEIFPGKYVLHRIIEITPNHQDGSLDEITLMGDGNIKGTEKCLRKDICGIVTHYIRPNRTIPADNPSLIRRIRLWRKLLPDRRYLLFIYKSII